MKFSLVSLFTKLTLATSVVATLAGCDDPKLPEPSPATAPSTAQARFRLVNAAPGSGSAQLLSIDNTASPSVLAAVPYLEASPYANIPAGQRLLFFTATTNLNSQQIVSRNAFNAGSNNTVFLTDPATRAASTTPGSTDFGGLRTVVLADNLSAPAVGNAKIRFVNLAPTATGGNTTYGIFNTTTVAAGVPLFSAVTTRAYRAISNTTTATPTVPAVTTNFADFTQVAAGTYTLDVRSAAATALAGTRREVVLEAGKIYTLYIRGIANNTTTPLGISVVTHN